MCLTVIQPMHFRQSKTKRVENAEPIAEQLFKIQLCLA